jgi:hypothetical protein
MKNLVIPMTKAEQELMVIAADLNPAVIINRKDQFLHLLYQAVLKGTITIYTVERRTYEQ